MLPRTALLFLAAAISASCAKEGAGPPPPILGATATAVDRNDANDVVEIDLVARRETKTVDDDLTFMAFTYDGELPGPLIQARLGDRIIVHFRNELPEPTTIHWHGMRVPVEMDGSPRVQSPVPPGGTFTYDFIATEAATFWYHPHVRTHFQVEHGLYGMLIVHGEDDPRYDAERMLVLDDILVDESGNLPAPFESPDEGFRGRLGNRFLTNGLPSEDARGTAQQGEVERWRLVDTANARTLRLRVSGDASVRVIGTDGGLLAEPFPMEELELAVGQRFDLEVSYTGFGEIRLESEVTGTTGSSEVWVPVFAVDVGETGARPRVVTLPDTAPLQAPTPDREETITFDAHTATDGALEWQLNGETFPEGPLFSFDTGDVVRFTLTNTSFVEHPFHLHGQFFTVVDDGRALTDQPGLKDTVLLPPSESIDIIAYLGNPGRWMAHCHNLEHAELGMMSEIGIGPEAFPAAP